MFEGILARLLNKYLGRFIEGLDKKHVELKSEGTNLFADLRDLNVAPHCLDWYDLSLAFCHSVRDHVNQMVHRLHLPITLRFGSIGRLNFKVFQSRHAGTSSINHLSILIE
jgi:hypothetical protein